MLTLSIQVATLEELNDVVARLNGVESVAEVSGETAAPAKRGRGKAKEAGAVATEAAAPKPSAPAAVAPDLETLKAKISKWAQGQGGDANAVSARIKDFVRSFGVAKISDMTEEQRLQASQKLGSAPAAAAEEDPMA